MKENVLINISKQFAVDIINLCTQIKEHRKSNVLLNQLLRSGTSIGANIHEANYAHSRPDFISKLQLMGCDINPTSYSKLEGQIRIATDKEIFAAAKILNVSIDLLFE